MKTTSKSSSKKRVITVSYLASPRRDHYCDVPFIRLSGKWIEEMGFTIGQRITVTAAANKLIISKADDL